jgi:deoxyribodipyrimidine photo-lyase
VLANYFFATRPPTTAWTACPGWARATLDKHRKDRRGHVYDEAELEGRPHHDPYYNAAMREMRVTGYMQGHMRMYWG